MKKRVAQWIGGVVLSTIAILIYLILYQTHLFSGMTLNALNKYVLSSRNMSVQGVLKGSLFGKYLSIEQIRILVNQKTDTLLVADEIQLSGWEWDWNTKELNLEQLITNTILFDSRNLNHLKYSKSKTSGQVSLIVQQITANHGELIIKLIDSLESIRINDLSADLWMIDEFNGLRVHAADVFAPSITQDTLRLSGSLGIDAHGDIDVNGFQVRSPNLNMTINSLLSEGKISASMRGSKVAPAALTFLELPELFDNPLFDFDLKLHWDGGYFKLNGPGSIYQNDAKIPFKLSSLTSNSTGQALTLILGTELSNMHINSQRDTLGNIQGFADIFRIDLNQLIQIDNLDIQEPIGKITFSMKNGLYSIAPRLHTFILNEQHFDSLRADLTYFPDGKMNISKGLITQADNRLLLTGSVTDHNLDLMGSVFISSFSDLPLFNSKDNISGLVSSEFKITGSPQSPHISGEFNPEELAYANTLKLTGLGKYDLNLQDNNLQGDLALIGNEGFLFGDSLLSYNILAHISEGQYILEDLHFQGVNNLVSMSGGFGSQGIEINKLNVLMENNQLRLVDTVQVSRSPDGLYKLPESVLAFNRGGMSLQGNYTVKSGLSIQAGFELIDIAHVMDFLRLKQSFEGVATGSANITGPLADPIIHTILHLHEGLTLGYPSDSARIDLTISGRSVISNRIDAYKSGGTLNLYGQLPWGYKVKGDQIKTTPQNFSINLDNYRLLDLKFTSIVGLPISGRANGSLSIRGTPEETKLDGQIGITDGAFDTLRFSKAYSDFVYEDNLFTFDSLSMVSNWGYGSGTGFLPLSLDLIAADRMAVSDRDMGLDFDFNLNEMPFLSSYLSFIDVIKGDFIGNMAFRGPMLAPLRSGHIRGNNIYLEVSDLGNPITDVHSEVTLVDNTLTIDHFSGHMLFSEGSTLNTQGVVGRATTFFGDLIGVNTAQNYAGEVNAKGNIDLQSFFHPRFDISLEANEVYYRSTDGMIEAIADAQLQLVGQDTLDVTAVLPVKRAVYYSNFESEEAYQQTVSQDNTSLFRYNLDTQFSSDLLISNDQMEAEFEGELWLLDYGDGILRFTGNLTAQEGGKFYYLGNELTIISGEIIFQSVDFNPQLNMTAEIEIDREMVKLELSGDMNEPELTIDAGNTQLTQSDVLTYLTINQTLVEVSFDTKSALNPVKTYSELLVEKQLSKIGREITGLDILDVGINLASDTTTVSRFQVGQRLSKNLKVTYEGALQPIDGQSDYDFGLEYRINQNVSVTSKINQDREVELYWRLKFTY